MTRPPAPRPCDSCPYRLDTSPGIWAPGEYARLPAYDRVTALQPPAVFLCHQNDRDDQAARVCAGWAGCHGRELLALRLAVARRELPAAVLDYTTGVPLHPTGTAAADYGTTHAPPGPAAAAAIAKITARRTL